MRTKLASALLVLNLVGWSALPTVSRAADSKGSTDLKTAMDLYGMKQYAPSADVFELVIRTSAPSARTYYYAALANQGAGRNARAQQLYDYVSKNFPGTAEATYSLQAIAAVEQQKAAASAQANKEATELPESVKNALPPGMRQLLNTDEGKMAMKMAMAENAGQAAAIRAAEKQNKAPILKAPPEPKKPSLVAEFPFTAEDIARDGAHGIDQSRHPNCWFEASMASLAELPHGQRLLAGLIRSRPDGYVVRFPSDGNQYTVTQQDLDESGIHDRARWASIIELAQLKKFPDNAGAEGADNDQSRLAVGLGCITGCKAEEIFPRNCSDEEISSFIGGAVSSHNPCVCATYPASMMNGPEIVVPTHAYTVVGLDKTMIILRNPHGMHSQQYVLAKDPQHLEFEQLSDGMVRISIPMFKNYFHMVCRSFI